MVVGEPRLDSLVSTPSKQDGRSLRETVRTDIDVSQPRFEVANALGSSLAMELLSDQRRCGAGPADRCVVPGKGA
jgi:hypothetical protein